MANYTEAEFAEYLTNTVANWNRDALFQAIEAYFAAQRDLRNQRVLRAANQAAWNARKAEFDANLTALRRALREATVNFENNGTTKRFCKEHFKALFLQMGSSTAIDHVHTSVEQLVAEVARILNEYRLLIGPNREFRPLVEAEVFSRFAPYAVILSTDFSTAGGDPDWIQQCQEMFAGELRATFEARVEALDPHPYRRAEAEEYREQNQAVRELEEQARAARQAVLDASSELLNTLLEFLRNNTIGATNPRIREMLRIRVIQTIRITPINVRDNQEPPAEGSLDERGLNTDVNLLMNNLETQWQRAIDEVIGNPAPQPTPLPVKKAHRCGAACLTQEGNCDRRTTEDGFCYQHEGEVPDKEAQALAGLWALTGTQSGLEHSGWQAELLLNKNGRARWKEIKGANPGAVRSGNWNLRDNNFVLRYRAPKTGPVEWHASGVQPQSRSMSGEYLTPKISLRGGTFSGEKIQD
jgi:hypothetical protein